MIFLPMSRSTMYALAVAAALIAGCSRDAPENLLASGKEYLAKNDPKAASIQLKNALQKEPNLAEARFLLGVSLLESNDEMAAEKELRRALDLRYPIKEVAPPLARTMVRLGQYNEVVAEFGQAEAATPRGTAELQTALGQAQLSLGRIDAARTAFAAAHAADAQYAPAMLGEARVLAQAGDVEGASNKMDAALAVAPGMPDAWHLKGDLLAVRKQPDAALAAYRKSVEQNKMYLPGHAAVVFSLLQSGKTEEAAKALADLKQVAPRHPQTFYLEALVRVQEKNYTAARDAIQDVLRTAPENTPALVLAGVISHQLKSYGQAELYFGKALANAPQNKFARRMLIANYVDSGQTGKAIDALKPLAGTFDKDPALLNLAGEAYLRNGDPAAAATYFQKAAEVDPTGSRQKTGLALTHLARGETERGISELEALASSESDVRPDLAVIATTIQRREFDKALAAVDGLEKKLPDRPLPSNLRGLVHLAKGDRPAARKAFEKALAIDPDFLPAATNLARLDLAEKNPANAEKRFQTVVEKNPKNSQALLALAELRRRNGAPAEEVANLIQKAITLSPSDVAPRLALIQHYLRIKDTKRAIGAGQEAAIAVPNRPEILNALAESYVAADDANQALATYNRLAEVSPGSAHPWIRSAQIEMARKNSDAAAQMLQKAIAVEPNALEAQRGLVALDLKKDDVSHALEVARQVQRQRPKQAIGYILEGDIYASRKSWKEALASYRAGLTQAGTVDAAVRLHSALHASGQPAEEADRLSASWLKEHPDDAVFRLYLAEVAGRRGDYRSAVQQYGAVLAKRPDDPLVLNNLAWASGKLNDPKALEYANKANSLAPNQPAIMDTLGVLLVQSGDAARGVELLKKASELAPNAPGIRLNLAQGLIKVGQRDAARKELEALAKLGDQFSAQNEVARLMKTL